mgnify:CR=1 FL=1
MACTYSFNIPVDPIAIMPMIQQEIEQNGGTVSGEVPHLTVMIPTKVGEIRGTYRLLENSIVHIVITKKPDIVSCNSVREKLVLYLTEAVKLYSQRDKAAAKPQGQMVQ